MLALARLARVFRFGGGAAVPPHDGYALWAPNYPPRPHNPLMETEQSIIAPIIASLSPKRALDVGTGTGRYLPLLAAAGARRIVGLDLSLPMLGHNACGRPRVCADARRLPFPDRTFDLVCASLMAGDLEDLGPLVREAARVLTPGGHLVYSDFHPSWNRERWRRTFRAVDGRQIVLKYFPHSIDQHLRWLEDAPFDVRTIREPRIGGRTKPVVVVFHAVKPHRIAQPRC